MVAFQCSVNTLALLETKQVQVNIYYISFSVRCNLETSSFRFVLVLFINFKVQLVESLVFSLFCIDFKNSLSPRTNTAYEDLKV